jgi:hypothetical protein
MWRICTFEKLFWAFLIMNEAYIIIWSPFSSQNSACLGYTFKALRRSVAKIILALSVERAKVDPALRTRDITHNTGTSHICVFFLRDSELVVRALGRAPDEFRRRCVQRSACTGSSLSPWSAFCDVSFIYLFFIRMGIVDYSTLLRRISQSPVTHEGTKSP